MFTKKRQGLHFIAVPLSAARTLARSLNDCYYQIALDAYDTRIQHEERRKYQARWKALFALRKLMESKDGRPLGAPPIRLAGGDRWV